MLLLIFVSLAAIFIFVIILIYTIRNKRKLIYGYEQNDPKKTNKFYTNNLSENFSIYISGNNVLIDNKEIKPANLYIRLIKSGLVFYKRNNKSKNK